MSNPKTKYISISQIAKLYHKSNKTIVDFSNEKTGEGAKLQKEEMGDGRKKILNSEFNHRILEKRFPQKKSIGIIWNESKINQKNFNQINPTITEQLSFLEYLKSVNIPIRFPLKYLKSQKFYNNHKNYIRERKSFFTNHLERLILNSFLSIGDTLNAKTLQKSNRNQLNLFGLANGDSLRPLVILKKILPRVLANQTVIQVFELDSSRILTSDVLLPIQKEVDIIKKKYKQKTEILIPLFSNTLEENNLHKAFKGVKRPLTIQDLFLEKDEKTSVNHWLLQVEQLDKKSREQTLQAVVDNITKAIQNLQGKPDQILELANILSFVVKAQKIPYSYLQSFDIVNQALNKMASLYSDSQTVNIFTLLGTYLDELVYVEKLKTLTNLKQSLINPQDVILLESSIKTENNQAFMEKTKRNHLDLYRYILEDTLNIPIDSKQFDIERVENSSGLHWQVVWTSPENYRRKVVLIDGREVVFEIPRYETVVVDRYNPMELESLVLLIKEAGLEIRNMSADGKNGSCVLVVANPYSS